MSSKWKLQFSSNLLLKVKHIYLILFLVSSANHVGVIAEDFRNEEVGCDMSAYLTKGWSCKL